MTKIDLKDVEFQIPIRVDHENRLENLELLVDYLNHHFDTNITVMESSERSILQNTSLSKKVNYIWEFDDKEYFHRTRILNLMAKNSKHPIIVNQDTDVLLNIQNYFSATEAIRRNEFDVIYPYDGRFMEVLRNFIPKIKENMDVSWIKETDCNLLHPSSVGGIIFENREKFLKVGMENEKCISYGFEDNERFSRFLKLGLRVVRLPGFLIHLFHWRGKNSEPTNDFFNQNMREYNKIAIMNKTDLENYIKTW